MNKAIRKQIDEIIETAGELKQKVEEILEGEESKYDNLPEGIQESETGEQFENCIGELEYAIDSLDEVVEYLGNSKGE